MDVDRYLGRIGYEGSRAPSATTLAALHRDLLAVPFDALDPYLGRAVSVGAEAAYAKVVEHRRGGFCFELNGLFAWALAESGFDVSLHGARPQFGPDFLAPPLAHLVLLVEAEGRWITDVGFGFPWALEPLGLAEREVQERGALQLPRHAGGGGRGRRGGGERAPAHRLPSGPRAPGQTLRATESTSDLRASIDKLVDNLERQITSYREKRRLERRRRTEHHGV